MADPLEALLEQIKDPSVRAAIGAGWELGNGVAFRHNADQQLRKEMAKNAELLARKMDLDADLVHGAALLAMSLTKGGGYFA